LLRPLARAKQAPSAFLKYLGAVVVAPQEHSPPGVEQRYVIRVAFQFVEESFISPLIFFFDPGSVVALIRRAEGAVEDYEEAREHLTELVAGNRTISLYFRCLRRLESAVHPIFRRSFRQFPGVSRGGHHWP